MTRSPRPRLYPILCVPDPAGLAPDVVARALCAGAAGRLFALQVRMKDATSAERAAVARAVAQVAEPFGVPVWMNDDGEAALAAGPAVAGLHVGQDDPDLERLDALRRRARSAGRTLAVGISTHDEAQLRAAVARRPDLVAFGPVRPTRSKARPDPTVGFARLAAACRSVSLPVVAIGGLGPGDAPDLARAGVAAVATISAVSGPDPDAIAARTRAFVEALDAAFAPWPLANVAEAVPVVAQDVLATLPRLAADPAALRVLGLPPRFRPFEDEDGVWFSPADVADLLAALDKDPDESWEAWRARHPGQAPPLRIRRI